MKHYLGYLEATNAEEKELYLPNSFIKTDSIKKSLDNNICFICGRKGSGKSAVALMLDKLTNERRERFFEKSYCLFEDDYSVIHNSFQESFIKNVNYEDFENGNIEQCFFEIWSYILELVVFNLSALVEGEDFFESILSDSSIDISDPCNTALIESIKILEEIKDSIAPVPSFISRIKKLRNTKHHKKAIEKSTEIFKIHSCVISIDTMETYDISENRIFPLKGLCRAVKEFHSRQLYTGIHIKCFLPAEITDDLFKKNLAKYNQYAEYLSWNYSDLIEFLAKRFVLFLNKEEISPTFANELGKVFDKEISGSKNKFWFEEFWIKVAPTYVINKLGWQENSCAYMIRHTQKRPREVLSCMNFVIEKSISSGSFPMITEEAIKTGIHDEDNLYNLLSDNLAVFTYPKQNMSIAEFASSLLADEHFIFSSRDFSRFAKRALSLLSDSEVIYEHTEYAKAILLRSGLVGRVVTHNGNKGNSFVNDLGQESKYYVTEFEYLIPGKVVIGDNSLCAVHPILADRLKLRAIENDIGVVYPIPEIDDLVKEIN